MSEHYFCACKAYEANDPGMVVCWICEQPVVMVDVDTTDGALIANLLTLGATYRRRLEKIADAVERSTPLDAHPFELRHTVLFKGDDWFSVQAAKDTLDSPLREHRDA